MAEPQKKSFFRKRTLRVRDDQVTRASQLTVKQSILPICLVTILYFLWVGLTISSGGLSILLEVPLTIARVLHMVF